MKDPADALTEVEGMRVWRARETVSRVFGDKEAQDLPLDDLFELEALVLREWELCERKLEG